MGQKSVKFEVVVIDTATIINVRVIEEPEVKSLTILCEAKGHPLPNLSWFDGRTVLSTTKQLDLDKALTKDQTIFMDSRGNISKHPRSREFYHAQVTKDSSLKLKIIFRNKNDARLKNVRCEAENIHGKDEKSLLQDEMNTLRFADGNKTEVQYSMEYGQKFDLNCEIEGTPRPKIRWNFVS